MVKFQASRRATQSTGAVCLVCMGREKTGAERKQDHRHEVDHGVHRVEEVVRADKPRPTVH
jgi:hypothetical protein